MLHPNIQGYRTILYLNKTESKKRNIVSLMTVKPQARSKSIIYGIKNPFQSSNKIKSSPFKIRSAVCNLFFYTRIRFKIITISGKNIPNI